MSGIALRGIRATSQRAAVISSRATTSSRPVHTLSRSRASAIAAKCIAISTVAALSAFGLAHTVVLSATAHAESPPNAGSTLHSSQNSTCSLGAMPTATYNSTEHNVSGAEDELKALLGVDRVTVELGQRISHSSTEWSAAPRGELDRFAIVLFPRTTEEVSGITKICHRRRIPMTAFSGGTSLEGTLAATQGGVCIDFKLMDKIVELHKDDLDIVVQPGVEYEELNRIVAAHGLFFPPDPGPGSKIGGMVSQSCSGTNAYRYGTMKDWVLGLTLVLADGTVVKTRARPRKSNCGYDLTRLIVGSEGTLAFVTEANLKLTSKPKNERVAVAAFPSMKQAVQTVVKIVQNDMPLQAMEVLCDTSMHGVNEGGYCNQTYAELPTLFFKFAGKDAQSVEQQMRQVQDFANEASCKSFDFSNTEEEAESIWSARKSILWSMLALKNDPSDGFISADSAVPISKLADAVDEVKEKIAASGLMGFCLGHAGDGNFHTGILYPKAEKQKARELITWVQRQAIRLDGTVTGEHGVGLEFRDMVPEELGQSSVDMMRQLKLALDPLCLLNPDKVFRLNITHDDTVKPTL